MNVHMYQHPAVISNMNTLAGRGVQFIEPGEGLLACGYVGKGRLEEVSDDCELCGCFLRSSEQRCIGPLVE